MTAVLEKPDVLDGIPKVITSDAQNDRYIAALLDLERRAHLTPAEKNLAEVLTLLVEAYEEERHPIRTASPIEVLKELIDANNLRQKDLAPLLGSESVVSEVLSGKRELNKHHIEKLSKKFRVSPAVFF
ncbi:MAG: helix-turn-helix domain-containing protein [Candidatus Acidiferrales bacterium]